MKLKAYLTTVCLSISVAHSAVIFSDNFDSLAAGNLVGQGGWTQNVAGAMTVVNDAGIAYSSPNYMTLGASGAPQHTFASTDLTVESTSLTFYFLSNTTQAGHNIQLSMRTAASGSGSFFYLNLLGTGLGLQAGTGASSFSNYSFSSALSANTWYLFSATTDPVTDLLTFSVTPASGGGALVSGSVDISGTAGTAERMVFSSNASTVAGDWAIDSINFSTVPEPSAVALIAAGAGVVVSRRRRSGRASSSRH